MLFHIVFFFFFIGYNSILSREIISDVRKKDFSRCLGKFSFGPISIVISGSFTCALAAVRHACRRGSCRTTGYAVRKKIQLTEKSEKKNIAMGDLSL